MRTTADARTAFCTRPAKVDLPLPLRPSIANSPHGTLRRREAARQFYRELTAKFHTKQERPTHRYFSDDVMILDQQMTGTVTGTLMRLSGNDRRITFRILHVFEFKDGLISRENVWLDGAAIHQHLGLE